MLLRAQLWSRHALAAVLLQGVPCHSCEAVLTAWPSHAADIERMSWVIKTAYLSCFMSTGVLLIFIDVEQPRRLLDEGILYLSG